MRVGKYELGKLLGEGSIGVVYLARDTEVDRTCAVKLLRPELAVRPDVVRRFVQQANAIARIPHPNIATVLEAGTIDGNAYIAMELLDGRTLDQHVRMYGKVRTGDAIAIAHQIAAALDAAHAVGLVHTDLQPHQIYVLPGEHVKVLDFGKARLDAMIAGGVEGVFGAAPYLAPESHRGGTAAGDVYSLGVILFEMLCGVRPFDDANPFHRFDPPKLRDKGAEVTQELEALVDAMLSVDPDARPTASEVAARC